MTILSCIQDACDRLGIVRPSSVIGSSDQQIRQLLGLAQQEGKELARRHNWQLLTVEKTFTSIAAETQTGVIPADFDRGLNDTFYNRTSVRPVQGPLDPVEWQSYKASLTPLVFDAFRIRGGALLLAPTPSAGVSYAYEYVSTYWVAVAAATTTLAKASWTIDTDVGILSEELMTDGVVWRFLRAKGLDYAEAFRTYEAQVMLAMARDGGKRKVNMVGSMSGARNRPRYPNYPDGSWPVS